MIVLKDLTETLQLNAVTGLVAPTRKGYVHAVGGSGVITLTPGGTIANGDWMIIVISAYDSVIPTTPTGWTVLQPTTVSGTQSTTLYGKIRKSGDTSYSVTLNLGSPNTDGSLFWGSGSDAVSTWVIGATKLRSSISPATSIDTIAPSLTTTTDHTLVLSFATERTIADDSDIVSIVGAQKWAFFPQFGATDIQSTAVGVVRDVSPAGATSDVQFTYVNAHPSNGQGIQIGIPPANTVSLDSSVTYGDIDATGTALLSSYEIKTQANVGSTLFGNEVPSSQNETGDTGGVELGVSFTAFVSGTVTAIRYYKGVGASTATKDGHLWSDAGVLLASVTFVNETASGWQTQYLSTPVALTGGLNYTVSYYTPNGNYANTSNYFLGTNKYSGPLAIDFAAGAGRNGNGVFKYSASSGVFPDGTFNQTNYFADVVFVSSPQTAITTILGQPVTPKQRVLKQLSVVNVGTQRNAVAIMKWRGGSAYLLSPYIPLLVGELLSYDDSSGWKVFAADGSLKANFAADDITRGRIAFNNDGSIGGTSDITWASDQDTLTITGVNNPTIRLGAGTATLGAPSAGNLQLFAQKVAGKIQLMKQGPSADAEAVQASLWQNNVVTWTPASNIGTWIGTVGAAAGSTVQVAPSATNKYTQMRRSTFASLSGAGSQSGIRTEAMFLVGSGNNVGGFFFSCRFGFDTIKANDRAFVGMSASIAIVTIEPSSMSNMCGFGFDSTDSAWTFMHNNGTGPSVKEAIPGQGTLATNNTGYDAYIWNPSGSNTIYYRLDRLDTGATLVEGVVSAFVPVSNVFLVAGASCGNGTNTLAGDVNMGVNRLYVESNR